MSELPNLTAAEDAELDELIELGKEITAAMQSPLEPACIAHAFATPAPHALTFTMQGWIDLSAAESPLLIGKIPQTLEQVEVAAKVFGVDVTDFTAEESLGLCDLMLTAIESAFAMALPMTQEGQSIGSSEPDGFGTWLPLFAYLVATCGYSKKEACSEPVGCAYALLAATRRNDGWKENGASYALREVDKKDEPVNAPAAPEDSAATEG